MTTEVRKALLEAMAHFDQEIRGTFDFENSPKYRYFVEHDGRRYPVKKIISRATGKPLDTFYGGRHSNDFVTQHGFTVIDLGSEPSSLQRAFNEFLQDPHDAFMVKLRRVRAEQLRQLLAVPNELSPEQFDREVWRIESATILGSKQLQLAYRWHELPVHQITDLETELENGRLELHGNYIWGIGSRIYAPNIKDGQQRSAYIHEALKILTDPALTPLLKTQRIREIHGFGPNVATGLVMVFHPAEFALFNVQSQEALQTLGYKADTLEEFEEAITELMEELGAEDFLELDLFLYLGNQGRYALLPASGYWWVNQGESYGTERPGGYLFAHKKAKNGAEHQGRDLRRLNVGDITFHYANGAIQSVGRVHAPAVESIVPDGPYKGPGGDIAYSISVTYHDLTVPIILSSIPIHWRTPQAGPFDRDGKVKMPYLMQLAPAFVEQLVRRWPNDLPAFLTHAPNVWLFQANPERYRQGEPDAYLLKERVRTVQVGQEDYWRVTRFEKEMRPGDKVILWQGGQDSYGKDAGIYAFGELSSAPEHSPGGDVRTEDTDEASASAGWRVRFVYTRLCPEPIPRSHLREHPILQQMQILKAPQGTNFRVTQEEWTALQHMISQPPKAFDQLLQSLVDQGYSFPPTLIANYLLALQTKRFVILTGISGTGKTQIALATARALQPRVQVGMTPYMPEDAFTLQVHPYMLKYHQMVLPAALVANVILPTSEPQNTIRQINVQYPGGQIQLTYTKDPSRNVTHLVFRGAFRTWFDGQLKQGDSFLVEPIEHSDGSYGLRFSLPHVQTRVEQLANYLLVAVRPDWTDNRGLLGYYNPLLRSYSVTPLLRLLLNATADVDRAKREQRKAYPFFVILDEMNLARVEHYFSDFLSAMESGETIRLHDDPRVEDGENEDAVAVPRNLRIPENAFFTGTVNVDETTYMFSPKVLDRAFTLEFNTVDLLNLGVEAPANLPTNGRLALSRFEGKLEGYVVPSSIHWKELGTIDGGKLRDTIVTLHELLEADQRHFGYRVANEIARFVLLAREQSDGQAETLSTALDLAILEKVLPKFHGTQQELGSVLVSLFDFAVFGERRDTMIDTGFIEQAWTVRRDRLVPGPNTQEQYHKPALPHTAAKVWTMLRRLRQQGFTSFIA